MATARVIAAISLALLLGIVPAGCSTVPRLPMASSAQANESPGLALRWLGTSTVTISDGHSTVMVDAFLSRTGKSRSLLSMLGLPVIMPDQRELARLGRVGIPGPV